MLLISKHSVHLKAYEGRMVTRTLASKARPRAAAQTSSRLHVVSKMFVPSDSFGGRSPEKRASEMLVTMFTFIAVKVVLAQLEGSGRGTLAAYDAKAYSDLMTILERYPLKNGDEWLSKLMVVNQKLAVRIMEVRAAYAEEDFEWENCQRIANNAIKDGNVELMRKFAEASLAASFGAAKLNEEEWKNT